MDKRFLAVFAALTIVLGGFFYFTSDRTSTSEESSNSQATVTNHVRGGDKKVQLVEYGDFQCPACAQYYPIVEQVYEKYSSVMSFQFRNFPLFQIHQNAIAASRAAEAAGKQDKYWEMYSVLYQNQTSWANASDTVGIFSDYAKQLGLDTTKFAADYKSKAANDSIQADIKEGTRLGVTSTPTFFLNGKQLSNPDATVEAFSKVIDAELKKQGIAVPTETTPATTTEAAPTGQ